MQMAQEVIAECHPEQLIVDGKYLTSSALSELISTIIHASKNVAHTEMDKDEPIARKLKEQVTVSSEIFLCFLTFILYFSDFLVLITFPKFCK